MPRKSHKRTAEDGSLKVEADPITLMNRTVAPFSSDIRRRSLGPVYAMQEQQLASDGNYSTSCPCKQAAVFYWLRFQPLLKVQSYLACSQHIQERSFKGTSHGFVDSALGERESSPGNNKRIANGYLFFDWYAIPQITARLPGVNEDVTRSDAALAVQSIPAYVEAANLFIALVPELTHTVTGAHCNYAPGSQLEN